MSNTYRKNCFELTYISIPVDDDKLPKNVAELLPDKLPNHIKEARFDHSGYNRRRCEDGTREEILRIIYEWLGIGRNQSELTTGDERILWLRGLAGSGKSTIAHTTAYKCIEELLRCASFFCSRDTAELSNHLNIFTTICYQLCQFDVDFMREVARILKEDKDLQHSEVERQLQKLILGPLKAARHFPSCVVVIDVLDECTNSDSRAIILSLLGKYAAELSPLMFFITSRPGHDINVAAKKLDLSNNAKFSLDEVDPLLTDRDLEIVLRKELRDVRREYSLPISWPADEQVHDLVGQAQHLFIFASTAIKYIADATASDPERRLERLLKFRPIDAKTSPFVYLDDLYHEIFASAFLEIEKELEVELQMVLKALILCQELFSISELERLMQLRAGTVRRTLLRLHALIVVPDNDEEYIRLIHPSIYDFLTDNNRCIDDRFFVNKGAGHFDIVQHCFQTIADFSRCPEMQSFLQVPTRQKMLSLRRSLKDIEHHVVEYSYFYWSYHIKESILSDEILVELELFLSNQYKSLLMWYPYRTTKTLFDLVTKFPASKINLKKGPRHLLIHIFVQSDSSPRFPQLIYQKASLLHRNQWPGYLFIADDVKIWPALKALKTDFRYTKYAFWSCTESPTNYH